MPGKCVKCGGEVGFAFSDCICVKEGYRYLITEVELRMFHMAAMLQVGSNEELKDIVDKIKECKVLWRER